MPANRDQLEAIALRIAPPQAKVDHLGTGGYACTFRITAGADVFALKIIDPETADVSRVERELGALQRVDHRAVVKFREVGEYTFGDTTYQWIAMDFVEGHTLRQALDGGQVFSSVEAVTLLRNLVEGAAAIWGEQTAHRDLGPRNIMLQADGTPVIVDLGLAKHVDDETMTALPTPGTPGWMSPEQVGSSPTHGDWRSDQFVLGSIGYLLLTGVAPFHSRNIMECWLAPATVTPRSIRSIDPNIPVSVADVVERMMNRQPHRRYLKVAELLADLERAIQALADAEDDGDAPAEYYLTIGTRKTWAANGFLNELTPDGAIVDAQAGSRVSEFGDASQEAGGYFISDPSTWFARSPEQYRPAAFTKLPYGTGPALTGFSSDDDRRKWCKVVWDAQIAEVPDVILTPYFYAGEGELNWVRESLACAQVYADFAGQRSQAPEVWTSVLIHANWLSNPQARDRLLTLLTGQPMERLYLLVHTGQLSFGPLGDVGALTGFRDLFEVMRDAGVPVVAGKRASSGLLLLALGAAGWGTGISANLMNSAPHPEEEQRGGPPADRVYVPRLLNQITTPAYVLMRNTAPHLVELGTGPGNALLAQNANLESLTTGQRILLNQHNQIAQRARASELSGLPAGQRISRMRDWVTEASEAYRELPPSRQLSDGSGFLAAWDAALS
ncbi:serine/threonine protein kinase [Agromyces sp. NPDC058104]|uniref:serine/threonine protein kinase n=1 Tax=Agromyces sp. NPDC058104 TaxID=3346342 RepID=UPI0036DF54ED